jgi:hypothetical protein
MNNLPNNIVLVQLRKLDGVSLARLRATSKKMKQVIDGNRNLRNKIDRFERAVRLVLTSNPLYITPWRVRQRTVRQIVELLRERQNNLPQNRASAQRFMNNVIGRINRGPQYRTITGTNTRTGELRRVTTEIPEPMRNYSRPRR